jgi:ABC-type sugar transport system substrate-binding protein
MSNRRKAVVTAVAGAAAAAALTASLSGCGGVADAGTVGVSGTTSIELIGGTQSDSFTLSLECGAAVEARKLGIGLTVTAPAADTAAEQLPLVQGVIVGNPDALIIDPAPDAGQTLETTGAAGSSLAQALFVAQENDTKVIFAGGAMADRDLGASRITSDDADGGRIAADNLGKMLAGKGVVAVITAPDAGTSATARIAAFHSEMAARYPGITVLAAQSDTADSAASTTSLVADDLQTDPDLGAVLALTQNTTQGAITALGQANKTGKVKLATFDASPFQMTGLDTGTIQLTVAQEPTVQGADAVDQAVNAVADKAVTPFVGTPMVAITPQNMNDKNIKPYIYDGTCASSLRGAMTDGD